MKRRRTVPSSATAIPPQRPSGTTTRHSRAVMPRPLTSSGVAARMISTLKKLRTRASISTLPGEARLDEAPEDDDRPEEDQIGERTERERRRIAGERLAGDGLRQDLGDADDR